MKENLTLKFKQYIEGLIIANYKGMEEDYPAACWDQNASALIMQD